MIRCIDHTTITVANPSASIAFYTGLLGFAIDHTMDLPESHLRIVFLRLGDSILELFCPERIDGRAASDVNEVVGYKHVALAVDNCDEEYRRLSGAGVKFRSAPATVGSSVRVAFFKDPDGLDIELIQYLS